MIFKDVVKCVNEYTGIHIGRKVLDVNVEGIFLDSRKCKKNSMFVAYQGAKMNSHNFVESAYDNGARFFILNYVPYILESKEDISYIIVKDSRDALALCSRAYYNYNDEVNLIGITGTNGKTSTTHFINELLINYNINVGSIGTLGVLCNNKPIDKSISASTTPEYPELIDILDTFKKNKVYNCVMETTSHALELKKVHELKFKVGVFTNLTQDHLDFHSTLESYFMAKAKLFEMCDTSFINIDDEWGVKLLEIAKGKVYTYSAKGDKEVDFCAKDVVVTDKYVEYTLNLNGLDERFKIFVPGQFTVYNTMCAILVANVIYGISAEDIRNIFANMNGVPGRMQSIESEKGFNVVVDYAHTPDALENVIKSAKDVAVGRVVTIFGCGGDRDKTKRPIMAEIATSLSDFTVITSDNPRTEEPSSIIDDILKGACKEAKYITVIDREEAIKYAIENAEPDDFIIIAGKGHENYQEVNGVRYSFDDVEIAKKYLGKL